MGGDAGSRGCSVNRDSWNMRHYPSLPADLSPVERLQRTRDEFAIAYATSGGNHPPKGSSERKSLLDMLRRRVRAAERAVKKTS